MKYVKAQFSLKYSPVLKIRRFANDIEDFLQNYYGAPQTMPVPDEIAPEAPRIVLYSQNGHSQISFSQVSVDFIVNFDNDYTFEYTKTQKYIVERILLITSLLKKIGVEEYLFCGITYSTHLDIGGKKPVDYMKRFFSANYTEDEIYEASQNVAFVRDDKYFINQQLGTFKAFQGVSNTIPIFLEINSMPIVSEGVALTLDVNNRYQYVFHKRNNSIDECVSEVENMFSILADKLGEWEKSDDHGEYSN